MALLITKKCINCDMCEPECPKGAIHAMNFPPRKPKVEAPKAEAAPAPKVEAPKVEAPQPVEAPKAEAPKAEA